MKYPLIFSLLLGLSLSPISLTLTNPTAVMADTIKEKAKEHNDNGLKLLQAKSFRMAALMFQIAVNLEPENSEYHSNLVSAYFGEGDYTEALKSANQFVQLKPSSTQAYAQRALVKKRLKDYMGSIADYDKAIELDPTSSLSYTLRGIIKRNINQREGAIADLNKGLELARSQKDNELITQIQDILRDMGVNK